MSVADDVECSCPYRHDCEHEAERQDWHECPYGSELGTRIAGPHAHRLCRCCEACEYQCARDI